MSRLSTEPPDEHVYTFVVLDTETLRLLSESLVHYQTLLGEDVAAIEADPDLNLILGDKPAQLLPVKQQFARVARVRDFLGSYLAPNAPNDFIPNLSHGTIRFLKSVGVLYLRHLRSRRDAVAQKPRMSAHVLQAVDERLARLEGVLTAGVFGVATSIELMAAADAIATPITPEVAQPSSRAPAYRPVVVSTIEILDGNLQERCLDLLEQFRTSGEIDRLDTVVVEATRILEDRLHRASGAPANITGVELAQYAFASSPPRLLVSPVDAEQQAVHLLFRGVFGFVRNSVHHRLVGQLQAERVLQIVGMIDYLLSLIQGAQVPATKP